MEHYEVMYAALCEYAEENGYSIERIMPARDEVNTLVTPTKGVIIPTHLLSLALESIKGRICAGCFIRNDIHTMKPQLCIYWIDEGEED
jgi:hypothetical protein